MSLSESAEVDYSDFRVQSIVLEAVMNTSPAGPESLNQYLAAVEPMAGVGGLANNEVAELVAHRIGITFDSRDNADAGDQDVGGGFYLEGTFGANADNSDLIPLNLPEAGALETTSNQGPIPGDTSLRSTTQGRMFELLQVAASLPFDDGTNGPGGGEAAPLALYERDWRHVTGRGPVLDQTDDVTLAVNATAWDSVIEAAFVVQCHLIWDVAEMSDAGRVFSVPSA